MWHTLTTSNMAEPASLYTDFVLMSALSLVTYRKQHYSAGTATVLLPAASGINFAHRCLRLLLPAGDRQRCDDAGGYWSFAVGTHACCDGPHIARPRESRTRRSFGFDLANFWIETEALPAFQESRGSTIAKLAPMPRGLR